MLTDQLSDFLTRIRNAGQARLLKVDVSDSKLVRSVANILVSQGYLKGMKDVALEGRNHLRLYLKYEGGDLRKPVIQGLKRESRPGLRVYVGKDEIPKVLSGFGISILSTNKGVLAGEEAKQQGVGGELLCSVW